MVKRHTGDAVAVINNCPLEIELYRYFETKALSCSRNIIVRNSLFTITMCRTKGNTGYVTSKKGITK
jgi:hypothetical protein